MARPRKDLETVRDLLAEGLPVAEVTRRTGIARSTIRSWLTEGLDGILDSRIDSPYGGERCDFCHYVRNLSESSYAYLLGLYLGDGCISPYPRDVYKLRIFQDNRYPALIRECMVAMAWVIPKSVGTFQHTGCKEIYSYSKHWPCVFPQHGPGPKHRRVIELEPWQRWVAIERHPELLLRGLIHSDGWRGTNCATVRGKRYEYSRYMFSNRSEAIRRIFTDACDRAGIDWRQSYEWIVSVSQHDSVAKMDKFIGLKS